MDAQKWFSLAVFVIGTCSVVYCLLACVEAWNSPEFKRDMEHLREQRRRAKAARRGM